MFSSLCILLFFSLTAQVNFVNNPSFEILYDCLPPNYIPKAKYWNCIDSLKPFFAGMNYNVCYPNVPNTSVGYQLPKTGAGFIRTTFYCPSVTCTYTNSRTYPKNRLKSTLTNGITYCVRINVNLQNTSTRAIDAIQILLADQSIDTIKYVNSQLVYLSPQVSNTVGIISDTLNWIEVHGTFIANGAEKYLVIGNFKSDPSTSINSTTVGASGGTFSEYFIDDVSVIDFNLPAYAGPDKNITLGDSTFIGRPPEIGLECTWATGTTTIGTGGGLWVKPTTTGTFSYVVTQNICGNIKTDTVNVNVGPSGISENSLFAQSIGIYPQPAKDIVNITMSNYYEPTIEVKLMDVDGREVSRHKLIVQRQGSGSGASLPINSGKAQLETLELSNGVYILQITNSRQQTVSKRMVIAK